MTEEELEEVIQEQRHVLVCLGFDNFEQYLRYKTNAVAGMIKYGDIFVQNLAYALEHADTKQAVKIINAFRNECTQHELLYRIDQAKKRAANV